MRDTRETFLRRLCGSEIRPVPSYWLCSFITDGGFCRARSIKAWVGGPGLCEEHHQVVFGAKAMKSV